MRGITLWQPWASAVALGMKLYETRSWLTQYRGPLAIHAAKRWRKDQRDYIDGLYLNFDRARMEVLREHVEAHRGVIVAQVELTEIHNTSVWRMPARERLSQYPWGDFSEGRFAWRLERPVVLAKPIPFRGSQTFFTVPDELIDSAR